MQSELLIVQTKFEDCFPKTVHITQLTDVATRCIMDYLDPSGLRSLRAVCKITKVWVDCPRYLKRIKVYIKDYHRMKEIMNSQINWSNVSIPPDLCDSRIIDFIRKFRSSLIKIKIQNNSKSVPSSFHNLYPNDLINILLNVSSSLEILDVKSSFQFQRKNNISDSNALKKLVEESITDLTQNLFGLKIFKFQVYKVMSLSNINFLHFVFVTILRICPNIVALQLPFVSHDDQLEDDYTMSPEEKENKFIPLASYLKALVKPEPPASPRFFTIDFDYGSADEGKGVCCTVCTSDPEEPIFPLTKFNLLQLVEIHEMGSVFLQLWNIPIWLLPNPEELTESKKRALNQAVRSVFAVICYEHTQRLAEEFQHNILFVHPTWEVTIVVNYIQNFPHLPISLNIVEIFFTEYASISICKDNTIVLEDLFQVSRPSVTKLSFVFPNYRKDVEYPKLSTFFPNLKKLFLTNGARLDCMSNDGTLGDLHNLEDLTLKFCSLTTNSSIGEEVHLVQHPLFAKFKKLARLRLEKCHSEFLRSTFQY